MGFFDNLPAAAPREPDEPPAPPVWDKPDSAIGVLAADQFVLGRSDDAAIAITGLTAFTTGFEFTLTAVLRRHDRHGRPFHVNLRRPFLEDDGLPDEFIRLGLQFADGTVATNLDRSPFDLDGTEPVGPLLWERGGGGGGRRYDQNYWVWPLPPAGPLTFVCAWPAKGIAESRAEIDAQPILDAATRATVVWPDED
jgi:hypothetical protein